AVPRSPMPNRPGNEVGCNKIPLALGKLISIKSSFRPGRFYHRRFSALTATGDRRSALTTLGAIWDNALQRALSGYLWCPRPRLYCRRHKRAACCHSPIRQEDLSSSRLRAEAAGLPRRLPETAGHSTTLTQSTTASG